MRPERRDDKLPFDLPPEIGLAAKDPIVGRRARPERRLTWLIVGALTLVIGTFGVGLIWWGMTSQPNPATPDAAPLVRAGETPIKERPTDPGGLSIADRDKLVYRRVGDDGTPPPAERLLPPPEAPAAPPVQPAPAPAEPVAEAATVPDTAEIPTEPSGAPAGTAAPPPASATDVADLAALIEATTQMEPTGAASRHAASTGAHQIQLASVRTEAEALSEWKRISGRQGDLLDALTPEVSRVELADRGVWFRLRAGPLADAAAAADLCRTLKARNVGCLVIGPSG